MQNGFTEDEAAAMAWICAQKAAGKFVGATSGLFLALTWGHYHDRIFHYFKFRGNKILFQLGIVMVLIKIFRPALSLLITSSLDVEEVLMNYLLIKFI